MSEKMTEKKNDDQLDRGKWRHQREFVFAVAGILFNTFSKLDSFAHNEISDRWRCWCGQCVALSISLLQKWRRNFSHPLFFIFDNLWYTSFRS